MGDENGREPVSGLLHPRVAVGAGILVAGLLWATHSGLADAVAGGALTAGAVWLWQRLRQEFFRF